MNQVSWLIYLSNVSENVGVLFIFLGIVVAIIAIAFFIRSTWAIDLVRSWNPSDEKTAALKEYKKANFTSSLLVTLAFFMWTVSALCPSQNTVLAIAASQVGEQLLKTPTASLAEKALNSWLQKQIAANTEKTKSVGDQNVTNTE